MKNDKTAFPVKVKVLSSKVKIFRYRNNATSEVKKERERKKFRLSLLNER